MTLVSTASRTIIQCIDFAKITVTVTISKNSGEDALLDGAEIIGQPIDISFTLVASSRKMVINQFIGSVERDLLLEDGRVHQRG